MKCLYNFESGDDFIVFSEYFKNPKWQIDKQLLKDRAYFNKDKYFFIDLKNRFKSQNLSIWDLKDEEVITWIDTIVLMNRILDEMKKTGIKMNELRVIMEYVIPYGNHMRTDYVIIIRKTIFVIEFGMFNQDERRSEERYSKKLHETIAYRQVLSNQLPNDIKIFNYVMIYKPEYDGIKRDILEDNIDYNNKEIQTMAGYIRTTYINEIEKCGYYYLSKL